MTASTQKGLAIAGTLVVLGVFAAANVHLISLAIETQPACALKAGGALPAKRAC